MNLTPDLITGVVPISKAASGLAALLRKARATRRPIIVTQKGYPTGVILDVETFVAMRGLAERAARAEAANTPPGLDAELDELLAAFTPKGDQDGGA